MKYTPLSDHAANAIISYGGKFNKHNKRHYLDQEGYRNVIKLQNGVKIALVKFWGSEGSNKDLWEMFISGLNGEPRTYTYHDVSEDDLLHTVETICQGQKEKAFIRTNEKKLAFGAV